MSDPVITTYLRERENLIGIASKIVQDHAIAEDLVQESWLRWSAKNYRDADAKPILRRIVSNLALDMLRRRKTEGLLVSELEKFWDTAPDSESILAAKQDLLRLIALLRTLPTRNVEALRLQRFYGMSYVRIGKKLGVAPSTAFKIVEDTMVQMILHLRS
ncbi:MAG: RNA polymerase sigma factor [Pseudomonadota bacterium]